MGPPNRLYWLTGPFGAVNQPIGVAERLFEVADQTFSIGRLHCVELPTRPFEVADHTVWSGQPHRLELPTTPFGVADHTIWSG